MKVAVIDTQGKVLATGEWDGKRVDGEFAKVGKDLYHCAYVYQAEHADIVRIALESEELNVKIAKDQQMKTLYDLGNRYRAR